MENSRIISFLQKPVQLSDVNDYALQLKNPPSLKIAEKTIIAERPERTLTNHIGFASEMQG